MKAFQKLALVSAIAALPAAGFAMEALDDATMSGVTGQDGISISIGLNNLSLNQGIEDTDGFSKMMPNPAHDPLVHTDPLDPGYQAPEIMTATHGNPGLLLITGMNVNTTNDLKVTIDTGTKTAGDDTEAALRLGVEIDGLTLDTGDIYVAAGTDGTTAAAGLANLGTKIGNIEDAIEDFVDNGTPIPAHLRPILESTTLNLGKLDLGIELGAGADNFLKISTTSALDIEIDNFVLNDLSASGQGQIGVDKVVLTGLNLNGTTAAVTPTGLALTVGAEASGINQALMGVKLGDASAAAPSLGNIYITGLSLAGTTLTISGK